MKRGRNQSGGVQGDFFGAPKAPPRDTTPVTMTMEVVAGSCTDKAWFLRPKGQRYAGFVFAARALCVRSSDPARPDDFTMPKWLARERGWL